ncbi:D-2-hydroxyacid dehydrogenase [Leuconostoc citreum]|uniref:D-2-hydroxyacid dehydrogenase n=1 Tax=Leuconostoc citreum TaxID=33964 RepID=UPI0021A68280|nr:D-2-hydroxyacid dehydrogenase [Leuconostoc citreum]MCT3058186.1 D-2-hydroxyacid dehydrogenase [Leuconostoc citreum]MDM7642176.1 D-2-hydroxyacid dehydrogenase [Leuconostoc citreum]MDY5162674.1 D-2-hydroxyacid dehydrogenase [Leuconostoc citreum]MDY5166225.1 D-2-hydroxyacid dehydrogenase [Leuconostoc citreum]
MTKILMTSVRSDEEPSIKTYAKAHNLKIDMVREEFHPGQHDNLSEYNGLIVQQTANIGGDEAFYQSLVHQGLKQITTRTAGVDMIPVTLAKRAGLKITNVPKYSPRSVAELALTQIFQLLRRTWAFEQRMNQNDFRWAGLQAREIHTITVGIIGAGRIGGTLAKLLHLLGAKVIAYDVKSQECLKKYLTYVSKATLLAQSDVISVHVDLNDSTVGLLQAVDFNQMKIGSLFLNMSRGDVVNTEALIAALLSGKIQAAALDTVTGESLVFNRDLRQQGIDNSQIRQLMAMPNVLLTPHIAFFTNIAVDNMVNTALDDVLAIIAGHQAVNEI